MAGVEAGRIQGPWVCKPAWLSRNWGGGRWALTTHGHHHSLLGPPLCLALCLGLHVHNLIYPSSYPFRFTPKETEAQRGRVTHPKSQSYQSRLGTQSSASQTRALPAPTPASLKSQREHEAGFEGVQNMQGKCESGVQGNMKVSRRAWWGREWVCQGLSAPGAPGYPGGWGAVQGQGRGPACQHLPPRASVS